MIHDAFVEVTCDGTNCTYSINLDLDYVYFDYSGKNGGYDAEDSSLEEKLKTEHEWIVLDGKHYCCIECAGEEDE